MSEWTVPEGRWRRRIADSPNGRMRATRRVCGLCGKPFAIVLPHGPETARDKLCAQCVALPQQPEESK